MLERNDHIAITTATIFRPTPLRHVNICAPGRCWWIELLPFAVMHIEGILKDYYGGLLLEIENADSGEILLTTDADWRVWRSRAYQQNTPRIACQLPWEEQFDARLHTEGWQLSTFDDRSWANAQEIGHAGCAPWETLSPRTIPLLTDEPHDPEQIWSCGIFQRPDVVAAVHLLPAIAPGDSTANKHIMDVLLATCLSVPQAGNVTFPGFFRCPGSFSLPEGVTQRVKINC